MIQYDGDTNFSHINTSIFVLSIIIHQCNSINQVNTPYTKTPALFWMTLCFTVFRIITKTQKTMCLYLMVHHCLVIFLWLQDWSLIHKIIKPHRTETHNHLVHRNKHKQICKPLQVQGSLSKITDIGLRDMQTYKWARASVKVNVTSSIMQRVQSDSRF